LTLKKCILSKSEPHYGLLWMTNIFQIFSCFDGFSILIQILIILFPGLIKQSKKQLPFYFIHSFINSSIHSFDCLIDLLIDRLDIIFKHTLYFNSRENYKQHITFYPTMHFPSLSTFILGCSLFHQAASQDTFSKGYTYAPRPAPQPPSEPIRERLGDPGSCPKLLGTKCRQCTSENSGYNTDCFLQVRKCNAKYEYSNMNA
jgi:hypothetical protein